MTGDSEMLSSGTTLPPIYDLDHVDEAVSYFRIDPDDANEEGPGDVSYLYDLALGPAYGITMTEGAGAFASDDEPVMATPLPAAAPLLAVGALSLVGVARRRRS